MVSLMNRAGVGAPVVRPLRGRWAAAAALAFGLAATAPAQAMIIHAVFDSTITSRPDAALIESAFNTVAKTYQSEFSNAATINVGVSWGVVKGQAMSSGDLGASLDNMYGYFSYAQMKSYLTTVAAKGADPALVTALKSLPSSISGVGQFAVASAEAKALGLISPTQVSKDGYIGFSSTKAFDFDPTDGITAGTYDFQTVAAHELAEVMGRISGLQSSAPIYRTVLDLFRYSAPGVLSFGYNATSYFSIDGGQTRLGDFNTVGGGDRSDWLQATGGTDVQSAFLNMGQRANLTAADLTALDSLGWGGTNIGGTDMWSPRMIAQSFMGTGVPEPQAWVLMIAGFGLAGGALRRRRGIVTAQEGKILPRGRERIAATESRPASCDAGEA